jgi:hypothetical protein
LDSVDSKPKSGSLLIGRLISQSNDLGLSGGLIEGKIQPLAGLKLLIGVSGQSLSVADHFDTHRIAIFHPGCESGNREFASRSFERHALIAQVNDSVGRHIQDELGAIRAHGSRNDRR